MQNLSEKVVISIHLGEATFKTSEGSVPEVAKMVTKSRNRMRPPQPNRVLRRQWT